MTIPGQFMAIPDYTKVRLQTSVVICIFMFLWQHPPYLLYRINLQLFTQTCYTT